MTSSGQCTGTELELVLDDNFDIPSLNENNWLYTQPWANHSSKGFNHSLEYQTDGLNYKWAEGILKLEVRKEKYLAKAINYWDSAVILDDGMPNKRWWDYTAGMIFSKADFGFGKYEMRCKVPKGKGLWSVFWMFGTENEEIDVFEFWNENNMWGNYTEKKLDTECHMTTHGGGEMCPTHIQVSDFSQEFHTYTLVWMNNKIQWFIDGDLKRTSYKFYSLLGQPLDCDQIKQNDMLLMDKTFPLRNLHIGVSIGVQPGKNAPDDNTVFPAFIEIDYIRYWSFKD